MASQAYVERIFSVCGLLISGHRNRMNKTLEMCMCHKLNRKMLRDSGFVYRVLASLTTQTVLCCDILWHSVWAYVSQVDININININFYIAQTPTVRPTAHYIVIISCIIRSSMYDWSGTFSVLGEKQQLLILFFSVQSAVGFTLAVQQWKMLDPPFPVRPWHDIVSATGVPQWGPGWSGCSDWLE